MRLRNKLFIGFFSVLCLLSAMALVGWQSMNTMQRQAFVSQYVQEGLTNMLLTECRQLNFAISKDKSFINSTFEGVDASREALRNAQKYIWNPQRAAMAAEAYRALDWYKTEFEKVVSGHTTFENASSALVNGTHGISANFEAVLQNANGVLLSNFSAKSFTGYAATQKAYRAFLEARLAARLFESNPTPENAQRAMDNFATAISETTSAASQFSVPENIAKSKEIVQGLEAYKANFVVLQNTVFSNAKLTSGMRSQVLSTIGNLQNLATSSINSIGEAKDSATLTLWTVAAFAFLTGLGVALWLTSNVLRQLGKDPGDLVVIAQRVTNGDYNIDDGSTHQGVYGRIVDMVEALKNHIENARQESARALEESQKAQQAMLRAEEAGQEAQAKAESMQRAAVRLEEVANIVSSASAELSAQIEQSERGAAQQASRVTETATAMEEMNSTVLEVAKNAANASETSSATRTKAMDGASIVQQAVASIQRVQEQSVSLKTGMRDLSDNAQSISQIMEVISDIADQTNLLALNAAIEAARAGEAGRGFAVVADEVRKLAEKTMQSTTNVGNAIKAMQQSAEKSMSMVDEAAKDIEGATALATRSGTALTEIVSMVESTADQVRAIATASEQQSASSGEITQSITEVNAIAGETARAMGEAARAVEDLHVQANVLSQLIDDMRKH